MVVLPRYEVRKCGDSWGAYDRQAERFLVTSTDKSWVEKWVASWNEKHDAGTLEGEQK